MEEKEYLLFFGELPSGNIHGISISNSINLSILSEKFIIHVVEEKGEFKRNLFSHFLKIIMLMANGLSIMIKCIKVRYSYFYLSMSLSLLGAIKTLVMMTIFKLLKHRGKIVLHIHRGDFNYTFSKNTVNRLIARQIIKLSDKNIMLSERFIIPELKKHSEFVIIPNTIIVPATTKDCLRKRNLLFISNYLREKGIIDLLEVMETFNENKIVLETYGQFAEKETTSIMLAFKSSRCRINGMLTSEVEKFTILCSSRCLILPSYNEGQPLIILEAMATGTPVIASNIGDIENMVGTDYPLLIRPGDKNALKSAILKIHNMNDDEYNSISGKLSERFHDLFSYEKHKNAILAVFN